MNFTFHNDDDDHDQNDVYKMFLHYYYHCIIITIIHCCHWICHHSGHIVYMNDGVLMVISTKKKFPEKNFFFVFLLYKFWSKVDKIMITLSIFFFGWHSLTGYRKIIITDWIFSYRKKINLIIDFFLLLFFFIDQFNFEWLLCL